MRCRVAHLAARVGVIGVGGAAGAIGRLCRNAVGVVIGLSGGRSSCQHGRGVGSPADSTRVALPPDAD
ncbi:hypothetical protein JTE90_003587 [Oedothorax gibbosus]|uniref:Uncharacterized protein n=1 Tax=Oedothorax gibbosus TaxID=931172 RepID=A0AAV6VIK9_9ARAC|nr:hypothetical protein JTE90_003587 [Oedothorax gibbosus]